MMHVYKAARVCKQVVTVFGAILRVCTIFRLKIVYCVTKWTLTGSLECIILSTGVIKILVETFKEKSY